MAATESASEGASLEFDLERALSAGCSTEEQESERGPQPSGIFGRFRFMGASQAAGSQDPGQLAEKDPLPPDEFRKLCHLPQGPTSHERLGSLKRRTYEQAFKRRNSTELNRTDSTPVFLGRKRPVLVLSSDEENDDAPKASTASRPQKRRLVKAGQVTSQAQKGQTKRRRALSSFTVEEDEDEKGSPQEDQQQAEVQPQMRMRIDANKDYGPKMVDLQKVGEVLEEDAIDDVLKQCEDISKKLQRALGSTEEDSGYKNLQGGGGMATPDVLSRACGSAARYIKSYQLIGINFLLLLAKEGVEGSILADEMGLGKTAQAICFLGCLREMFQDAGPHLVICPASLLENWQRELQRWCPSLNVVTYYGPNRSELRYELEAERYNSTVPLAFPPALTLRG